MCFDLNEDEEFEKSTFMANKYLDLRVKTGFETIDIDIWHTNLRSIILGDPSLRRKHRFAAPIGSVTEITTSLAQHMITRRHRLRQINLHHSKVLVAIGLDILELLQSGYNMSQIRRSIFLSRGCQFGFRTAITAFKTLEKCQPKKSTSWELPVEFIEQLQFIHGIDLLPLLDQK